MFRAIVNRYRYLTLVDKPINSLAINSIVEFTAETLQYCHQEFGLAPQLSVVMGAFAFRIGLEFAGLFFQSLNMRKKDTWIHRWIEKVFMVDLRRDCTFYELPNERYKIMAEHYRPQRLFTHFIKSYTIMNFFRGCYYLVSDEIFHQFCLNSLSTHDPFFLLPVPIILLNYLIVSRSAHPFLIHLTRKENRPTSFSIAFMTGLVFVTLPSVFPLGYIGLSLGHLTIRMTRNKAAEWSQALKLDRKN